VTLVFDSGFPPPTGGKGLIIGNNAVLALNTATNSGSQVCGLANADGADYNPSKPLFSGTPTQALPTSSLCAAWGVDTTATTVFHVGQSQWPSCDPLNEPNPQCVDRSQYSPLRGLPRHHVLPHANACGYEDRVRMGIRLVEGIAGTAMALAHVEDGRGRRVEPQAAHSELVGSAFGVPENNGFDGL